MKRAGVSFFFWSLASCSTSSTPPPGPLPPAPVAPSAPAAATASSPAPTPAPAPTIARPLSEAGVEALAEGRNNLYSHVGDRMSLDPPPRGKYVDIPDVGDDTFFVLTDDPAVSLDAAIAQTRMVVDALWHGPLLRRIERPLQIWVYGTHRKMEADLHKYVKGARADGFGVYWAPTNEIDFTVEGGGIGTLSHELVHPLLKGGDGVGGDFPTAPLWFDEGLASLYEVFDPPTPAAPHVLRPRAHFRLKILRDALQSPSKAGAVRMDTLFGMSDDAFRADENFNYSRAREMLRWLFQKNQLWSWYHAWRDGFLADPTGERAFQAAVGMTPAQANDAWVAWLRSADATN
jgi:hypothetical protein